MNNKYGIMDYGMLILLIILICLFYYFKQQYQLGLLDACARGLANQLLVVTFIIYCALYCIITKTGCLIAGMRIARCDNAFAYYLVTGFWVLLALLSILYVVLS